MARSDTTRKLAAIVAADVAGYSRLMGADEAGTLAALESHRSGLIEPKIAEHRGRIANTAGDSLLIEFPSANEALACAVEVQRAMAERRQRGRTARGHCAARRHMRLRGRQGRRRIERDRPV
jgi:adenylate cyclase